jgi:hypothetical protein
VSPDEIKSRKLSFMVKNVFLTQTLQDLLDKVGVNAEESVEIWYTFALEKPKLTKSSPQEEWVSVVKSLSHIMNEKAKTYIVGFFNGDLKVFDKQDHKEVFSVRQLHQDSIIEDALFLRNDNLEKKIVITCSSQPNAELKISELSHIAQKKGEKQYQFNLLAQSKEDLNSESFKTLSNNPMSNEYICSSGIVNTH